MSERITPAMIATAQNAYYAAGAYWRVLEHDDPDMLEWGPYRAALEAGRVVDDLKARYREQEGIGTMEMRAHLERARRLADP